MDSLYKQKIENRVESLTEWLNDKGKDIVKDQKHLDANTPEQIYWHFGYLMALKDVVKLIKKEIYELN